MGASQALGSSLIHPESESETSKIPLGWLPDRAIGQTTWSWKTSKIPFGISAETANRKTKVDRKNLRSDRKFSKTFSIRLLANPKQQAWASKEINETEGNAEGFPADLGRKKACHSKILTLAEHWVCWVHFSPS
jgi:hypothetical protein